MFRVGEHRYHSDGYDPRTGSSTSFMGAFTTGAPNVTLSVTSGTRKSFFFFFTQRADRIRQGGHMVVEKWECEWREQRREDPELLLWADTLDLITPLDPRDAFFGGRTEAVRAHCRAQPDQCIYYDDFTSLYPYVNKNCKYLVGYPVIHMQLPAGHPKNGPSSSAAIRTGWSNAASCLLTICFTLSYRSAWPTSCCSPSASNAPETKSPCPGRNVPTSATTHLRTVELSSDLHHAVQRLHQYMDQGQTRSRRLALARGGKISRPASRVPGRVSSRRRCDPRSGQDRTKRGLTHAGQIVCQQFLGEIRAAYQQDPGDHLQGPRDVLRGLSNTPAP